MWRLDKAEAAEATAMVHLNAVRYYMINNIRRQQKVMGYLMSHITMQMNFTNKASLLS